MSYEDHDWLCVHLGCLHAYHAKALQLFAWSVGRNNELFWQCADLHLAYVRTCESEGCE